MTPRGPKPERRAEVLDWVDEVADLLHADDELSANEIHRQVGGRRSDLLRLVRAFRRAAPRPAVSSPPSRFPNSDSTVGDTP